MNIIHLQKSQGAIGAVHVGANTVVRVKQDEERVVTCPALNNERRLQHTERGDTSTLAHELPRVEKAREKELAKIGKVFCKKVARRERLSWLEAPFGDLQEVPKHV